MTILPVLRSEWIKLRTARSTYIAVGIAVIVGLGLGLEQVLSDVGHWATMSAADRASVDPVGDPLSGFWFGYIAFGALGVLAVKHLDVSITDTRALSAVACAGLFMAVFTLVGFGLGALLRHTGGAMATMFALIFFGYVGGRNFESSSYVPDHLALSNAATTLGSLHHPAGPHAARYPSFGFAMFDLALYLVVFVGLGAWRALRDA